jgi:hypothetical protein
LVFQKKKKNVFGHAQTDWSGSGGGCGALGDVLSLLIRRRWRYVVDYQTHKCQVQTSIHRHSKTAETENGNTDAGGSAGGGGAAGGGALVGARAKSVSVRFFPVRSS